MVALTHGSDDEENLCGAWPLQARSASGKASGERKHVFRLEAKRNGGSVVLMACWSLRSCCDPCVFLWQTGQVGEKGERLLVDLVRWGGFFSGGWDVEGRFLLAFSGKICSRFTIVFRCGVGCCFSGRARRGSNPCVCLYKRCWSHPLCLRCCTPEYCFLVFDRWYASIESRKVAELYVSLGHLREAERVRSVH